MRSARFRFYASLNDFLPGRRQFTSFVHRFELPASVKDMIEAMGVPHPEVDLILVNSEPAPFSYLVRNGDRVSVFPLFYQIGVPPEAKLGSKPLPRARFVLDAQLGKLARYLRMLGFDSSYQNHAQDAELAVLSVKEDRILLTRDRELLKRGRVRRGYFVRETAPLKQVTEVLRRYELFGKIHPFQRCIQCNGVLKSVSKGEVVERLLPRTRRYFQRFRCCPGCGRIYWPGSHYDRMRSLIERIKKAQFPE